ncbi:MAG: DUF2213 domain-containing protein [Nitrospirota bacterium]|nr:DUF2213 domain-containing protein [Nitrospirota bacterium]
MVKDAPMLANEPIGPNQSLTPEGFLLCRDVPIARTGVMIYGDGEVPVETGSEGVVYVTRTPDEVFKPEAMASFEGKPVTSLHPSALVTPETWRDHVVGTVNNVRKVDNLLVADLLIADRDAIKAVQDGLREVSCGYDASYEQTRPGYAVQRDIVGNHVALVPKGRCGPTCAISDAKTEEKKTMKKASIKDRVLSLFKTKDEEGLKNILDELEDPKGGDVHIHLTGKEGSDDEGEMSLPELTKAVRELMKDKISRDKKGGDSFEELVNHLVEKGYSKEYATKIAGKVAEEKGDDAAHKDESEEEAKKRESEGGRKANKEENEEDPDRESYSGDSLPVLKSRSEILSPGIKLTFPTGDAKAKPFRKSIQDCKRQALKAAYATDQGRSAVDAILSGRCIDNLSPSTLDAVFMGASALMGYQNNTGTTSGAKRTTKDFGKQPSVVDINKANKSFWAERSAK